MLILNKGRIVFGDNITNIDDSSPSALLIRVESTPELNTLQSINGITSVAEANEGTIRLELGSEATISNISEQIVNLGWGLTELRPERNNLEQVFTKLTMDGGS